MTKHTPAYQVPPLEIFSTRQMTEADLVELERAPKEVVKASTVKSLATSHHSVAQALAKGIKPVEVSLITGVALPTIYNLRQDPTFQELLAHYEAQKDRVFVDVLDRLQTAGLSAIDELQARMMDNPKSLAPRELIELAELALVKGRVGAGGKAGTSLAPAGQANPGVTINVKFVEPPGPSPEGAKARDSGMSGPIIEGHAA